jgi:hypothetical protein
MSGMFGKLINPDTGQAKAPAQQQGAVQPVVSPTLPSQQRQENGKTERLPQQHKDIHAAGKPVEEIRMTLPLAPDLVLFLDQLERKIFASRPQHFRSKQRLTKNSIIRAWLTLLQDVDMDVNSIQDETDLCNRFKEAVGKQRMKL